MPIVTVRYDVDALLVHGGGLAKAISDDISRVVAETLDCTDPCGHLLPKHVSVTFEKFGNWYKTHNTAVIVTIDASLFPSRKENLQKKNARITKAIKGLLESKLRKGSKVLVWTRLIPGAFSEFEV